MFWTVFCKQQYYKETCFSLCIFNKAGFQTVLATQDPVETSEEDMMPLYKLQVDFHFESYFAKSHLYCCSRTLESSRICGKQQLEFIFGSGRW